MALAKANQNNVQMCLCVDGCIPKFNSTKLAAFSEKMRFAVWKQVESLNFCIPIASKKEISLVSICYFSSALFILIPLLQQRRHGIILSSRLKS